MAVCQRVFSGKVTRGEFKNPEPDEGYDNDLRPLQDTPGTSKQRKREEPKTELDSMDDAVRARGHCFRTRPSILGFDYLHDPISFT